MNNPPEKQSDALIHAIWAGVLVAVIAAAFFAFRLSVNKAAAKLEKPVGIITEGDVFSEFAPAGHGLPLTFSYAFVNASDNQTGVQITLAQKDEAGQEIITVAHIDGLPPKPKAETYIVVTAKIDSNKKLRMKVTIPETAYVKELGPFDVN